MNIEDDSFLLGKKILGFFKKGRSQIYRYHSTYSGDFLYVEDKEGQAYVCKIRLDFDDKEYDFNDKIKYPSFKWKSDNVAFNLNALGRVVSDLEYPSACQRFKHYESRHEGSLDLIEDGEKVPLLVYYVYNSVYGMREDLSNTRFDKDIAVELEIKRYFESLKWRFVFVVLDEFEMGAFFNQMNATDWKNSNIIKE